MAGQGHARAASVGSDDVEEGRGPRPRPRPGRGLRGRGGGAVAARREGGLAVDTLDRRRRRRRRLWLVGAAPVQPEVVRVPGHLADARRSWIPFGRGVPVRDGPAGAPRVRGPFLGPGRRLVGPRARLRPGRLGMSRGISEGAAALLVPVVNVLTHVHGVPAAAVARLCRRRRPQPHLRRLLGGERSAAVLEVGRVDAGGAGLVVAPTLAVVPVLLVVAATDRAEVGIPPGLVHVNVVRGSRRRRRRDGVPVGYLVAVEARRRPQRARPGLVAAPGLVPRRRQRGVPAEGPAE